MGKETTRTKRSRTNFSVKQLEALERVFQDTQYPDVTIMGTLAARMDLQIEKICTWFQNRRSKFRKASKKGHMQWMRTQLFSSDPIEKNIQTPTTEVATSASPHVLSFPPVSAYSMATSHSYMVHSSQAPLLPPHPYPMRLPVQTNSQTLSCTQTSDVTPYTTIPHTSYHDFSTSVPSYASFTSTQGLSAASEFTVDFPPIDWSVMMQTPMDSRMQDYMTSATPQQPQNLLPNGHFSNTPMLEYNYA